MRKHSDLYNNYPWVLITGNIRNETELFERLCFFEQLRIDNLISGVVFSTWQGEIDKHPDIMGKLIAMNAVLVESEQPIFVCRGHYLHQMTQLENGLDACPDDCFILRTRTDKCGIHDGFNEEEIRAFLAKKDYIRPCSADDTHIFQYRLGVWNDYRQDSLGECIQYSLTNPVLFYWQDRWYFGYKHDLQKLINYSVLSFDYLQLIPEQALFFPVFESTYSVLKYYVRAVNQHEMVNLQQTHAINNNKREALSSFLCSNDLFRHAFLTERIIANRYFFDLYTGENIPLITQYRGVELASPEDMSIVFKREYKKGYDLEIEALRKYLAEYLNVPPVQSRQILNNGIQRYKYASPSIRHYHHSNIDPMIKTMDYLAIVKAAWELPIENFMQILFTVILGRSLNSEGINACVKMVAHLDDRKQIVSVIGKSAEAIMRGVPQAWMDLL